MFKKTKLKGKIFRITNKLESSKQMVEVMLIDNLQQSNILKSGNPQKLDEGMIKSQQSGSLRSQIPINSNVSLDNRCYIEYGKTEQFSQQSFKILKIFVHFINNKNIRVTDLVFVINSAEPVQEPHFAVFKHENKIIVSNSSQVLKPKNPKSLPLNSNPISRLESSQTFASQPGVINCPLCYQGVRHCQACNRVRQLAPKYQLKRKFQIKSSIYPNLAYCFKLAMVPTKKTKPQQ